MPKALSKMFDYCEAIEPSRQYYKKLYNIDYYEYEKLYILPLIKKHIENNKVICDIGCGREQHLIDMLTLNNGIGVDIDIAALKENKFYKMKVCADCASLPFRTAAVDAANAFYVIEHLETPANAFNEFSRILKKNGKLILTIPNKNSILGFLAAHLPSNLQDLIWRKIKGTAQPFKVYYRLNTVAKIRKIAGLNKMKISKIKLFEGPPVFVARFPLIFKILVAYQSIMNRFKFFKAFRSTLVIIFENEKIQ